ncbi:hypothetical protein VD659_13865 [Herbiconiux sp. 11R-BC]|uniref:hypothetical protein n=1 Tax=Herbiconiux sp. 11R-BC TaxID=3111637 RepID=UPI003BFB6758
MRRRSAVLLLVAAFLTVFLAGVTTLSAAASWTAAVQSLGATANAATASLTATGSAALVKEYKFAGAATASANLAIAPLVFANTGSSPLALTLGVANTSATALPAHLSLTLWGGSAGSCAASIPSSGTTVGTLAAPPALPAGVASVAVGASVTVCAATRLDDTVAAYQGQTVSSVLTITGRVGTNWVTTASPAAFTQRVFKVADVGTITCTENPGTLTIAGTVTLKWTPVADATSYTLHSGSLATASFRTVAPGASPVSTTVSALDLGLTGLLASVPVVVQTHDSVYGTAGAGTTISLRTALLPLLSVQCPA